MTNEKTFVYHEFMARKKVKKSIAEQQVIGLSIALGVLVGLIFGLMAGNIVVGLLIGTVVGLFIGWTLEHEK